MVIQGAINSMFGGFARTITVPNSRKTWKASGDVIEAKVLSVEQRQPFIQVNAKNASQEGFYSREAAAALELILTAEWMFRSMQIQQLSLLEQVLLEYLLHRILNTVLHL